MQNEEEFLSALRSITVHLIKHVQPLYEHFVPLVELYDKGRWMSLEPSAKLGHVITVESKLPDLEAYYTAYPHGWSKDRFTDMKKILPLYHKELEAAQ